MISKDGFQASDPSGVAASNDLTQIGGLPKASFFSVDNIFTLGWNKPGVPMPEECAAQAADEVQK